MRILFTGVGRRIELLQAFRNAALVLNKELEIFGADMAGTAPALAYCDFTRKVVAMKDPDYIDNLLSICDDDHIDLLIPTIDTDLMVLSKNTEKFENIGTKVMISEPDKIRICRDKNHISKFFDIDGVGRLTAESKNMPGGSKEIKLTIVPKKSKKKYHKNDVKAMKENGEKNIAKKTDMSISYAYKLNSEE